MEKRNCTQLTLNTYKFTIENVIISITVAPSKLYYVFFTVLQSKIIEIILFKKYLLIQYFKNNKIVLIKENTYWSNFFLPNINKVLLLVFFTGNAINKVNIEHSKYMDCPPRKSMLPKKPDSSHQPDIGVMTLSSALQLRITIRIRMPETSQRFEPWTS